MNTAARGPHRIVSVPSSDVTFAQVIEAILEGGEVTTESALEATLRPAYPQAAVHGRELSGERFTTWYVYRDRTFARPRDRAWWLGPAVASLTLRLDGLVTQADTAAAGLLGRPVEAIIGRSYLELMAPAGCTVAAVIWSSLLAGSVAETVLSIPRPDGSTIVVEGRAARDDDRIVVRAREVSPMDGDAPRRDA